MAPLRSLIRSVHNRSSAVRRAVGWVFVPPWIDGPVSRHYGTECGTAIDRLYIERFLASHRSDIHGEVLEVKDDRYTHKFGHEIARAAVVDIDPHNSRADIVVDLAEADEIPGESFDCFILTQTLQLIPEPQRVLRHARRILRPGGVLLATLPALNQPAPPQTDYWRFLPDGAELLFGQVFGPEQVEVTLYGNLSAVVGGLAGISREQVPDTRLNPVDKQFPLVLGVRAARENRLHQP